MRQQDNWDCGVTSAYVVTRYLGLPESYAQLFKLLATKSIWTIDLAYLLHRIGVHAEFNTITTGIDPKYTTHSFYSSDMPADEKRVNQLFLNAHKSGVTVIKRSLSSVEFDHYISGGYLALVLINREWVICQRCDVCLGMTIRSKKRSFVGHFVVIDGRTLSGAYRMVDPASSCDYCEIDSNQMDAARRCFGTDEDVIFISRSLNHPVITYSAAVQAAIDTAAIATTTPTNTSSVNNLSTGTIPVASAAISLSTTPNTDPSSTAPSTNLIALPITVSVAPIAMNSNTGN